MFNQNTDKEWEKFGKQNPYYGVLSKPKYDNVKLTKELKKRFINSGYAYIDRVLEKVRKRIEPELALERALDFGCGVGRHTIPFSKRFKLVTGVDVAESMLVEAQSNCDAHAVKNVSFVKSDDDLSFVSGKYDFIHSYIVFQHIPKSRGERIFERLLSKLENGGVGVVQFSFGVDYKLRRVVPYLKRYIPLAKNIIKLTASVRGS